MSEIVEATQPRNNSNALVVACFLFVSAFAFFNGEVFFLMLSGLSLFVGLMPPPVVKLTLRNGKVQRISLGKERSPNRAIRIIKANVQEYQLRSARVERYTVRPEVTTYDFKPEENVRQYVLRLLQTELGYSRSDIDIEFPIKLGSSQKRADVVVFFPNMPHKQANISIIVECKRDDRRDDSAAQEQLKSYLSACLNARYGVIATYRWRVMEKINRERMLAYQAVSALADANGIPRQIDYRPGQPVRQAIEDEVVFRHEEQPIPESTTWFGSILSGNLKYAVAVAVLLVCTGLFRISSAVQPSSIEVPVINNASLQTVTQGGVPNQQTIRDTNSVVSPMLVMSARPFRTFTPSSQANQQIVANTTIAPSDVPNVATTISVEPTATITGSPSALPLTPGLTVLAPTDAPLNSLFGVINANLNVNVRQMPSTRANVITVLEPGDRVEIIGENEYESWLKILLSGGREGWIASRLVRIEPSNNR